MALVATGTTRSAERSEVGRGHAGFFGFAERKTDIEDAEATDEAGGFRCEQRAFQATDGHREVGAERWTGGVVAESARKVDRDAQSAEGFGDAEEGAQFGRERAWKPWPRMPSKIRQNS